MSISRSSIPNNGDVSDVKESGWFDNLADLSFVVTLTVSLVYTMGWGFAIKYFESFNIGILAMDIPREYFIGYGLWALKEKWCVILLYIFVALMYFFLRHSNVLKKKYFAAAIIAIIPLVTFMLFYVSFATGRTAGLATFEYQRDNDYPSYQRVQLLLKEDNLEAISARKGSSLSEHYSEYARELESGCYRLLLMNNDNVFVFRTFKDQKVANPAVDVIPVDMVRMVRALASRESCD